MKSMRKTSKASKAGPIGIVGAGPSGIAAAWFLMKKGYTDVTILEAEEEVGGKCRTVNYTDSNGVENNYELGAEYITYAYDLIFEFMKEVSEKSKTAGTIMIIEGGGKFIDAAKSQPFLKVLPAMWRYAKILKKYNKVILNPSNVGVSDDPFLTQSSKDFIAQNNLEALQPLFLVTQFGYGTLEDFPAINLMRTVPLSTLRRTIVQQIPILSWFWRRPIASLAVDGTQGLFKKMADELDRKKTKKLSGKKVVKCGEKVEHISKLSGGGLSVKTTKGTHQFDKVICAVPPDLVAGFADFLPDEEKKLMTKTKYHPYYVGCLDPSKNLNTAYYQNEDPKKGEPVQFSKRWADSPIMAYGYNFVDTSEFQAGNVKGEEYLRKEMKAYLKSNMLVDSCDYLSGGVAWNNYHPHVPLEDFQAGYYDALEAYQGKDGIFLTGDAMSMESMEYSCKYSQSLIQRFF